jgi:hypothetical protein
MLKVTNIKTLKLKGLKTLKGPGDSAKQPEALGFWTLSIVLYSKYLQGVSKIALRWLSKSMVTFDCF